jgi:hypothetical protein
MGNIAVVRLFMIANKMLGPILAIADVVTSRRNAAIGNVASASES